ncbi:MAG: NAD(P)-dependent alcohol dehydrogenase [Thermoplasmata archaeon]|nr:MAG: NAD(P)-dependent alcohol dehydrogenase [Thermoplasmata archaeon]
MKAIVWTKYGSPDYLKLQEVDKPTPKDNEVLIKIHATTVTAGDTEVRRLKLPMGLGFLMRMFVGLRRPKRLTILGQELAGEIEAVGKDVKRFKKGDHVFGSPGFNMGAYAEYKSMPANPEDGVLAKKPANMTFEEAASVIIGGMESMHFLGKANIQSGEKVLINGAGGSIGTFGVQFAKSLGAEVTAVDSTRKMDMLWEIGADEVIDYTKEDFTKSGKTYDVIFDVVGKAPYSGCINSLKQNGRYQLANPRISKIIRGKLISKKSGKKVTTAVANYKTEDLIAIKELIEEGKVRSVIDRCYPLEQIPEAHRYVEKGGKKGNVVITLGHDK